MQIERYSDAFGRTLNRPLNKKDLFIFMHCSNGLIAVTTKDFNDLVWPMMKLHGICYLEITDNTKK